jgi:hypothetical protein
MSEDKHIEEKEKLKEEIERSLSVVKMKEAHKQIEDIEKSRKQASIKSICLRISSYNDLIKGVYTAAKDYKKENPDFFSLKIGDRDSIKQILDQITKMYESIYFDLQTTIDIKKEDFNRLFPKVELNFTTYDSILFNLSCLIIQLIDMGNYCLRLL